MQLQLQKTKRVDLTDIEFEDFLAKLHDAGLVSRSNELVCYNDSSK